MFTFILWAAIIIVLFIAFKRIARGLTVFCVFIAMVFFAVFMLDTVTTFPIRSYISLNWYDDTIEDPGGAANKVKDSVVDSGKKVADKITETGKKVDVKYGTADNKEWTAKEGEKKVEPNNKTEETTEAKEENVSQNGESNLFIAYGDIQDELKTSLKGIPKEDKQIIESMTSIYKTTIEGTTIIVSNKKNGETGVTVEFK